MFFFLLTGCKENVFQGVVSYDMDYVDKTKKMNDSLISRYIGKSQIYFFKENKYKSVMTGILEPTVIYSGKETLYSTIKGSSKIEYVNVSERSEKLLSVVIKEKQEVILGYECDVLKITTNDGVIAVYFSDNLKINEESYQSHKKGFWDVLFKKTKGAIPLKWVTNTSGLKLTIKANKIEPKILNDSIFKRPK